MVVACVLGFVVDAAVVVACNAVVPSLSGVALITVVPSL
jgi:hypothetical protein